MNQQDSTQITRAATWLATTKFTGNVVVELRKRFSLTAVQAVQAIREASLQKVRVN